MKVLFLDFDGVLNSETYQMILLNKGLKWTDQFGPVFDPEAVKNLGRIVEAIPGLRIMVTSSWKIGHDNSWLRSLWKKRDMPGSAVVLPDYVPIMANMDITEDNIAILAGKGYEIQHWLDMNATENCRYVIVDDMDNFLPEQIPYLVQTNPWVGLTEENACKVIKLLTE